MPPAAPFVLRPENRPFVEGKEPLPPAARPRNLAPLLLSAAIAVGAAVATWLFFYESWAQSHLLARGVKAQATVVRLQEIDSFGGGDDMHSTPDTEYHVTYAFDVGSGPNRRRYERETNVDENDFGDLHEGGTVPMRYDPADPTFSRLESQLHEDENRPNVLPFFIALFWGGALWGFGCWLFQRLWFKRWLTREGRVVHGEATGCRGETVGKNYRLTLDYRFTAPDGRVVEAEATAVRNDLQCAALPVPGDPVLVFCAGRKLQLVL
jgi:hypothetical protein